jgi:aminopeptidase YwaD
MSIHLSLLFLLLIQPPAPLPEFDFDPEVSRRQITFLASDALLGRMTGEPGLDTAAAFIARHFEAHGLKPNPQTGTYYQPFEATMRNGRILKTQNVVGIIDGTDPLLKDEYVIVMAHYDHVGARRTVAALTDTIYNGARDNAMGVVALMHVAEAFSKVPTRRSVIILPVSAEEIGLLGSRHYIEHPVVPLDKTVYVSNIDGAGYNTTEAVTVIGLNRTTAKPYFEAAGAAFGLAVLDDPAPEQGLFNRSDNVNFASRGVPAPTFSAGFTAFDTEIMKYYHQPADQADEHFDFDYLHRYVQVFVHATRLIADADERIVWTPGDTYEAAFHSLYSNR